MIKKKIENIVKTTKFKHLRQLEEKEGFIENKIMGIQNNNRFFFNKGGEQNFNKDLDQNIIDVINKYQKNASLNGVFHSFTGTKKLRNFCLDNNYYISLSGIVTFKNANNLRETIKPFPLNFILIETDSPFLTPTPYRNIKPNEPLYVFYVGKYLAKFFDISIEEFEKLTDNNFYSLFNKAIRYKEILYEN